MNIMAFLGSAMLFAVFAMIVLFVLINMSSRLALIILLVIPILPVLLIPDISIAFLSYRQMLLASGLVPVNNFHILLMLWSTLIGIILYTEFLTWYLGKGIKMKKGSTGKNKNSYQFMDIQKNTSATVEKVKNILMKRN